MPGGKRKRSGPDPRKRLDETMSPGTDFQSIRNQKKQDFWWAFATASLIESFEMKENGRNKINHRSVQQLINVMKPPGIELDEEGSYTCTVEECLEYLKHHELLPEDACNFTGVYDGNWQPPANRIADGIGITGFRFLDCKDEADEHAIVDILRRHTVAAKIELTNTFYNLQKTEIYPGHKSSKKSLAKATKEREAYNQGENVEKPGYHAVVLIGHGTSKATKKVMEKRYWISLSSYGPRWCDHGTFRCVRDSSANEEARPTLVNFVHIAQLRRLGEPCEPGQLYVDY